MDEFRLLLHVASHFGQQEREEENEEGEEGKEKRVKKASSIFVATGISDVSFPFGCILLFCFVVFVFFVDLMF